MDNLLPDIDENNKFLTGLQAAYSFCSSNCERLADRQLQKDDTIIVAGHGCSLRVKHDALVIFPGKTHKDQKQETLLLYRGGHSIKRIILLSDTGLVSLSAVRWLNEQNIALMALDEYGNLLLSLSSDTEPDIFLRRAQYHASDNGSDLSIAVELVKMKAQSQINVLKSLPSHAVIKGYLVILNGQKVTLKPKGVMVYGNYIWKTLEDELAELYSKRVISDVRLLEARVAMAYWSSIVGIPIHWKKSDDKKVPSHWRHATERLSPSSVSRTAQHANNPYQAVTNYAYSILQSQCKQALTLQGFDVACGFLHADRLRRDSLVFDLMECHRASVDSLVLHLFGSYTFSMGEFMSTTDGSVKFIPQLARYIASVCRIPQSNIDASAVWLKALLLDFSGR